MYKSSIILIFIVSFTCALNNDNDATEFTLITPNEAFLENPFLKRFKCFVNVCALVAEDYGLEELWNEYHEKLQQHFENWENCKGNPIYVLK